MDKQTSSLKSQIASSMKLKDTDELISIWQKNNRAEWSDTAFEVVKELLLERGQVLPEQREPSLKSEEKSTSTASILEFISKNKKVAAVVCLFFVTILFGGISYFIYANQLPSILSLKDNWEKLESNAHSWQADAYLTNVSFAVSDQRHYPVEAEYHSQNEPNQIFIIEIDKAGKVIYLPIDEPSSSSGAQDPIVRQDWVIDSQEALELFAENEEVRACLVNSSGAQIQLSLNKVLTKDMAWELAVFDCQGKDDLYYLDAKSGKTVWQQ